MLPEKSLLINLNLSEISNKFDVTERTARRWLEKHELYKPKVNFRPNKLNLQKANEIRNLYKLGWTQQKLAERFNVTQAMICRIINNIAYHQQLRFAGNANAMVRLRYGS